MCRGVFKVSIHALHAHGPANAGCVQQYVIIPCQHSVCLWQMGQDSDCFFMIEEGTVSVEAQFVDVPIAQRAVDYPVNVADNSNNWCANLSCHLACN